ncbi:MAG: hypothetical protein ACRDKA_08930 [Actinomycetota bacterium]
MKVARWLIPPAGVAALVLLFLMLRPTDEPQPRTSPGPTVTGTPAASPTPESPESSPTPTEDSPDALEAEIEVEEGRVQVEVEDRRVPNPATIEVTQGERVALRVEADVTDEVHVHGYDLLAGLTPGERVTITFRATIPGVFEIELEQAGELLAQLEVRP